MRALFLTLLLCGVSLSAPVPTPRVKSLPEVTPGEYVMTWAGSSHYHTSLHPGGAYAACQGSSVYVGTWDWDSFERLFTIKEWYSDPEKGVDYSTTPIVSVFAFGDKLSGKSRSGQHSLTVELRRSKR